MMKSETLTWHFTTSSENSCGRITVSRSKRWPSQGRRLGRFCYVFGGINKKSSSMSCSSKAKLLIRNCVIDNWTVCKKRSSRSDQLWPIGEELCSIRTTSGHTSTVTHQKLRKLDWGVLMHPPYSLDLELSDYCQFLYMANDFAGRAWR